MISDWHKLDKVQNHTHLAKKTPLRIHVPYPKITERDLKGNIRFYFEYLEKGWSPNLSARKAGWTQKAFEYVRRKYPEVHEATIRALEARKDK